MRVPFGLLIPLAVALPGTCQQEAQRVLEALRADVAAQENAVAVLAWSAVGTETIGSGDAQRRGGELRARVVAETGPYGRLHVWFEPQVLGARRERSPFVSETGQAVADGKRSAIHRERWGPEGGPAMRAEGPIQDGRAFVGEMVDRAGAVATLWRTRTDARIGAMLRDARAEDVTVRGATVSVRVLDPRGRRSTVQFERRDHGFALSERRDERAGGVDVFRAEDFVRVGGKLWFPRRVVVEGVSGGEPVRTEVAITEVQPEPRLDASTFTLVVPARTPFTVRDGAKPVEARDDAPELTGLVKLASATRQSAMPPTAPAPGSALPAKR